MTQRISWSMLASIAFATTGGIFERIEIEGTPARQTSDDILAAANMATRSSF